MSEEEDIDEAAVDGKINDRELVTQTAPKAPPASEGRLKNGRFGRGFTGNSVCRQNNWDSCGLSLREHWPHLLVDLKRRSFGEASVFA